MNPRRLLLTATVLLASLPAPADEPLVFQAGRLRPISPALRGQNPSRNLNGKALRSLFALCRGSMARGLAGGLDADTYDWRDRDGGSGWGARGAMPTTLEYLQLCRDHRCEPMLTANLFGGGNRGKDGTWTCKTSEPARLAADWVRYCNFILPRFRQNQQEELSEDDRRILESITGWDGRARLLPAGEPPPPRVQYWEIGNEPELNGIAGLVDNHRLDPQAYATRYARIARAMRTVDPSIRVGPCLIYPARGARDYLIALRQQAVAIDFVSYHPYYHDLQRAWGKPAKLTEALLQFKGFLTRETVAAWQVVPRSTPLIASEWNPMMWNATGTQQRSMAMAMGVIEGIFTFAELGVGGAMFWEQAQSKPATRAMYQKLQDHLGSHLMFNRANQPNYRPGRPWRVYATTNLREKTLFLWVLNFQNDKPLTKTLAVRGWPYAVRTATAEVYTPAGEPSLMAHKQLRWTPTEIDVANQNGLLAGTLTVPPASVGLIRLSEALPPQPRSGPAENPATQTAPAN